MKRLMVGAALWNPVKQGTEFTPSPDWAVVKTSTPTGAIVQYFRADGTKVAEYEE
jgi:hypothetical protein